MTLVLSKEAETRTNSVESLRYRMLATFEDTRGKSKHEYDLVLLFNFHKNESTTEEFYMSLQSLYISVSQTIFSMAVL